MTSTYKEHARICAKFYDLSTNSQDVAKFVWENVGAWVGARALFVGGMFGVAAALMERGLELVIVDYSEEMVALGRERLPSAVVKIADLETLEVGEEFDFVLVVGRVFTHMIADAQVRSALKGCAKALKIRGRLFADNYESSKIERTSYFNGIVAQSCEGSEIARISRTTRISTVPHVVRWEALYEGQSEGHPFKFADSIDHRAFTRSEFACFVEDAEMTVKNQGDNFDETSFFTVAER